jgi:hypothetical protein
MPSYIDDFYGVQSSNDRKLRMDAGGFKLLKAEAL